MTQSPIGILDSGIGGLTIWREITSLLPHESTIYIADSKHCPYGEREKEFILERGRAMIRYLLSRNAKLIVIACNTLTVVGVDKLRSEFNQIPIIGIVPVVKTAAEISKKKRIGILSTTRTAESEYQKNLIEKYAQGCHVINLGTNKLVPCIEKGEINEQEIRESIHEELTIFRNEKIDTLALGCSHYPFVKNILQNELGEEVLILDSGQAVARQVECVLAQEELLASGSPGYEFVTTGDKSILLKMARRLTDHGTIQAHAVMV